MRAAGSSTFLPDPEAGGSPASSTSARSRIARKFRCFARQEVAGDELCGIKRRGTPDLCAARSGRAPRKITAGTAPSYFHAWSPDSGTIAFTRGSAGHADIFTISAAGGTEIRLTTDTVNDGPDFSPDGKFIYFDSSRSGATQIWRMQADGTGAEQLTDDENENSSPHVSHDGKNVAFLSQPPDSGGTMSDATLKVIAPDGFIRSIATFQGDRGSLSMYCWGDASHIAFITYQISPIRQEPRESP